VELPVYRIVDAADPPNERWKYVFSWSGVPVGDATITLAQRRTGAKAHLSVGLNGGTNGMVDLLWSYRMHARGEVRLDPFAPCRFVAVETERGRSRRTTIDFGEHGEVTSLRRRAGREKRHTFAAPNTFDMISTVVLALNLDGYAPGKVFRFDTLTGTARYLVQVRVAKRERVLAAGGKHDAWRLEIRTRELTDPREERKHEATDLWVSAERPRRLLKARSKTFVGAITVDLEAIEPAAERGAKRRKSALRGLAWRRKPAPLRYIDLRGRIP
jgi:hypothetical protein